MLNLPENQRYHPPSTPLIVLLKSHCSTSQLDLCVKQVAFLESKTTTLEILDFNFIWPPKIWFPGVKSVFFNLVGLGTKM